MKKIEIKSVKQGKRLQEARELTLLSRRSFAKKYGINISSLQAWEEGRHKNGITLKNAITLITALLNENINCTADWLLDGTGEPPERHTSLLKSKFQDDSNNVIEEANKFKKTKEKNKQLIQFIKQNNILKTKELIKQGANLHILNKKELYLYSREENTALHLAAQFAGTLLVKLFLDLGINPNIRNRYNDTALHFAAYENNIGAIKTLISSGANIEASNIEGTTPLMWAAINGRKLACNILVEHGANINNTDFQGNTAMHWAAFDDQASIIEELYHQGLLLDIINHENKTPLDIAIRNGQSKAAEKILMLKNKKLR